MYRLLTVQLTTFAELLYHIGAFAHVILIPAETGLYLAGLLLARLFWVRNCLHIQQVIMTCLAPVASNFEAIEIHVCPGLDAVLSLRQLLREPPHLLHDENTLLLFQPILL